MSKIQSVWMFIRKHKYFAVIAFFTIMVGFVDENSFYDRYQRIQEINALRAEMQTYQNRYEQNTRDLQELKTKPEAVVRVAREQYLMKYPKEDIYVFIDDTPIEEAETKETHETAL